MKFIIYCDESKKDELSAHGATPGEYDVALGAFTDCVITDSAKVLLIKHKGYIIIPSEGGCYNCKYFEFGIKRNGMGTCRLTEKAMYKYRRCDEWRYIT